MQGQGKESGGLCLGEQPERRFEPSDPEEKIFGNSQEALGPGTLVPKLLAGSCGGAPIAIIRQYIEQQQTPH